MRKWLRDPVAQTADTALTPFHPSKREVSALPAVSAGEQREALDPARWLEWFMSCDLPGLSPERRDWAADALAGLMVSGGLDKALALGWEACELVGTARRPPHDAPHVAGLIWSLWPGDTVADVRRAGCAIVYPAGRHIWLRRSLAPDAVCLPWDLAPARVSAVTAADVWES